MNTDKQTANNTPRTIRTEQEFIDTFSAPRKEIDWSSVLSYDQDRIWIRRVTPEEYHKAFLQEWEEHHFEKDKDK